jgi:hypothetical protein
VELWHLTWQSWKNLEQASMPSMSQNGERLNQHQEAPRALPFFSIEVCPGSPEQAARSDRIAGRDHVVLHPTCLGSGVVASKFPQPYLVFLEKVIWSLRVVGMVITIKTRLHRSYIESCALCTQVWDCCMHCPLC